MKKFLAKFAILLAITVIAIYVLQFAVTKGLQHSGFENLPEWKSTVSGSINANVLIMGSSRAWVQYNNQIIDDSLSLNSYNLGMNGADFRLQYIRLKTYLAHNKKPQLILQNIDTDLLDSNNKIFQPYQVIAFLNDDSLKTIVQQAEIISRLDLCIPFFRYMGQAQAILVGLQEFMGLKHYANKRVKGFKAVNMEWDGENFDKRKANGHFNARIDNSSNNEFDAYLQYCKTNAIKVVLVYAPVYTEYTSLITNIDSVRSIFNEKAGKYNLHYFDYSKNNICRQKKYFYNATHLNSSGADLFTKLLVNDIKEQGIVKQ